MNSNSISPTLLISLCATAAMLCACGGGSSTASPVSTPTPTPVFTSIDPTKVPLGDGKLSATAPQVGYVYACSIPASANPPGKSPWINADGLSWDSTSKLAVQGTVQWLSQLVINLAGGFRSVDGNGLPSHVTGTYPIAASDPARAYDGNPNAIKSVAIAWGLPANPVIAAKPTCTSLGAIGVMLSGARVFNALDADGRDAVAHEVQDSCEGHPQGAGAYHYHNVSKCIAKSDVSTEHSPLVGYIADGFGIYGNRGEGGKALTNADLDECHGHSHSLTINGVATVQYHYHATKEYPYTVGCYKGTPVAIR